jgi:DNA polymerase I-like protein with 3'-5' exonuclease and polymerase domains
VYLSPMICLIVDDQAEAQRLEASTGFYRAVAEATRNDGKSTRLAFDCEGVNLSRAGTVELVSLCFENDKTVVYLVDLSGSRAKRVAALKALFECKSLEKVIHDSRMDCDALYHLHGITLKNVHDTSCFHQVITKLKDVSLNDVLGACNLPSNLTRDKSIYQENFRFWATRPLTPIMKTWASSDVDKLLTLADRQIVKINPQGLATAKELSMTFTTFACNMELERGLECKINIGRFIGPRGSNLRSLQSNTGTLIYQEHQPGKNTWMVYYSNNFGLMQVKRAMGSS